MICLMLPHQDGFQEGESANSQSWWKLHTNRASTRRRSLSLRLSSPAARSNHTGCLQDTGLGNEALNGVYIHAGVAQIMLCVVGEITAFSKEMLILLQIINGVSTHQFYEGVIGWQRAERFLVSVIGDNVKPTPVFSDNLCSQSFAEHQCP